MLVRQKKANQFKFTDYSEDIGKFQGQTMTQYR